MECCDGDSNPPDNRTTVPVGSFATFFFQVGRIPDGISGSHGPPSVMWLKDGAPARIVSENIPLVSTELLTTLSFSVQESDAGDYQCIFFDNNSVIYYAITPIRLDTGMTFRG